MKAVIAKIVLCMGLFLRVGSTLFAGNDADINSTQELIKRIAPGHEETFILEKIPSENGNDVFELEGRNGKVVLRGNNALAMARAFNWYLNRCCMTSVSWFKDEPVALPETMPDVAQKIRRVCRYNRRFFLNYCTFGYTMPWWQWSDWERFIDWMALNGINMPLAITGQEAIWQEVWRKHGMSDDQICAFFTGPGHLPWHRMANCDKWLGPLPQSYIDHQLTLQKQILKRERSLNMKPVLPAFAGHVPKAIKETYSNADIKPLSSYTLPEDCMSYFLSPTDPLFVRIQEEYLREQTRQFGTDHIYGTDPFNEMDPPSWEPEYLASVAKTIYKGMSNVDPQAEWVQMGWLFYNDSKHWTNERIHALVNSIPQGKMTILDYYCEQVEIWRKTNAFEGAPYIWCYLGNFGGNTEMCGNMKMVADRILATEADPNHGNLTGLGCTLEGFSVNRVVQEWLFELAWDRDAADVEKWIRTYAHSRCGQVDPAAEEAWVEILKAVYSNKNSGCGDGNIINSRPRLTGTGPYCGLNRNADKKLLADALATMLKADPEVLSLNRYQYDLVNVCRQFLDHTALTLRDQMTMAYNMGDKELFDNYSDRFLQLMRDIDHLLGTRSEFLIGKWLEEAKVFGENQDERNLYERSARVLISTWGQQNSRLTDYAHRDRAGLVRDYYLKRWELFVDFIKKNWDNSIPFDPKAFDIEMSAVEWKWANDHNLYDAQPKGDVVTIVRELCDKYLPVYSEKSPFVKLQIGKWSLDQPERKTEWTEWDVTDKITQSGTYLFGFEYQKGPQALEIAELGLYCDDELVAVDRHDGWAGLSLRDNLYKLNLKEFVPGHRYTLKAKVSCPESGESCGFVYMQKVAL